MLLSKFAYNEVMTTADPHDFQLIVTRSLHAHISPVYRQNESNAGWQQVVMEQLLPDSYWAVHCRLLRNCHQIDQQSLSFRFINSIMAMFGYRIRETLSAIVTSEIVLPQTTKTIPYTMVSNHGTPPDLADVYGIIVRTQHIAANILSESVTEESFLGPNVFHFFPSIC